MRVGIDAHCLGQRKTGNETYTYSLVKHLAFLEGNGVDYVVYLTERKAKQNLLFSNSRFQSRFIRPSYPLVRLPIGFAIESRVRKLDVLHAQYLLPQGLKCRTVLTVHDILYEKFPEYFTKADYYRLKLLVPWSCRQADHIITVSESSKCDLVALYGLNPEQITVTYLGADSSYRPIAAVEARGYLRKKYQIEGEFLLYVGAIQPRKNIPRLLSAFGKLKCEARIPHKLIIVGPKAWLTEKVFESLRKSAVNKDVIVTGYVPQQDLPFFYNAATAFAYVSMCEGFGLPVVEAMACGTPTITSRGTSLEEIAGDAAILVDPQDEEAIAAAIGRVLADSDLQIKLRELGVARSSKFSCNEMATRTQQIYRGLLS